MTEPTSAPEVPPPRPPPPPPAAPPDEVAKPRPRAWMDEWGLRLLALVLAVLLWTLVRAGIEGDSAPTPVHVRAEPIHPDLFVAFPLQSDVRLVIRGTTAERDDARERLGDIPTIAVKVEDLPPDRDEATYTYRWVSEIEPNEQIVVPFRRSLVQSISEIQVRVFRLSTRRPIVKPPRFLGVPPGWEDRIEVRPGVVTVSAPAQVVGDTIEPDDIDVSGLFEGGRIPEGAQEYALSFDAWRSSPALASFRTAVALPEVKAVVTFLPVASRDIRNLLDIHYPGTAQDSKGDYEWEPDKALPGLELGGRLFTGTFRGGKADLDFLEAQAGSWFYALRIPPEALEPLRSGAEESVTVRSPLGWAPVANDALRRLGVQFVPPAPTWATVQVTVRKKQPQ